MIAMKLFPTVSYTALRQFTPPERGIDGLNIRLLGSHVCGVEGFDVLSKMASRFEKMGGLGMPEGKEEESDADILALKFFWYSWWGCIVGASAGLRAV